MAYSVLGRGTTLVLRIAGLAFSPQIYSSSIRPSHRGQPIRAERRHRPMPSPLRRDRTSPPIAGTPRASRRRPRRRRRPPAPLPALARRDHGVDGDAARALGRSHARVGGRHRRTPGRPGGGHDACRTSSSPISATSTSPSARTRPSMAAGRRSRDRGLFRRSRRERPPPRLYRDQYFASRVVAEAMGRRLAERTGPNSSSSIQGGLGGSTKR